MRFTKMEGLGNDYVYVNCFREKVYDPEILARLVSDRHRGIGGDGLILIGPSARADFNMDIYNADGSRAEMCGNGIRCLGKYVYDHGMTEKTEFTVETQAGIKRLRCILQDGRVVAVCVDMGRPDIGGNCRGTEIEQYVIIQSNKVPETEVIEIEQKETGKESCRHRFDCWCSYTST